MYTVQDNTHNPMNVRLGKQPARRDERTLQFSKYTGNLAPAPWATNRTSAITRLGVMLNDQLGDCTCAAVGHVIQSWTAENGAEVVLPDSVILSLYEQVGGYVPGYPATDNGAVELDVLNYWRKNGVAGHPLAAYVAINPKKPQELTDAVFYFGASYIGLQLPISAQNQTVWDVATGPNAEPGSWGGHAVPVVAYDSTGVYCITWGSLLRMTWPFFAEYCDEAYGLLSQDWIDKATEKCPAGFDLAALQADLALLGKS